MATSSTPSFTKTHIPPTTRAKEWADILKFSDTFTRELPGDPVVPNSPFSIQVDKESTTDKESSTDNGTDNTRLTVEIPEAKFRASRRVPRAFWSWAVPEFHENPKLVGVSPDGANIIGLNRDQFFSNAHAAADVWSGNVMLPGSHPWSHCYGGHQFGSWADQLGDGRAISLGEVINDKDERWEIQFKGAGRTPYSRFADGYAVRRSSIREYLAAEHLNSLGIPTSRSLCLVFTDRIISREEQELGAIVTRLAPSWVRFGSFELPASRNNYSMVRELADYLIKYHFPGILLKENAGDISWNKYAHLFDAIMKRTALMTAHWQAVGFCHGVMNTDNMSVLGLTIDYGPYAFLDAYDPSWICNHSDELGRYAFDQQPRVALWNLIRLAGSLSVLIDKGGGDVTDANVNDVSDITVSIVKSILESFSTEYHANFTHIMRHKLGLFNVKKENDLSEVIQPFLNLLEKAKVDYTFAMRSLCDVPEILFPKQSQGYDDSLLKTHIDSLIGRSQQACRTDEWKTEMLKYYLDVYRPRLADDIGEDSICKDSVVHEVCISMKRKNPKFVLRNWVAQDVIEAAENGDTDKIDEVLKLVTKYAFDDSVPCIADSEKYAGPIPSWGEGLQCSCSS